MSANGKVAEARATRNPVGQGLALDGCGKPDRRLDGRRLHLHAGLTRVGEGRARKARRGRGRRTMKEWWKKE